MVPCSLRRLVPPKRRYLYPKLYEVTNQKTGIAVRSLVCDAIFVVLLT
jgi:hypothetical protein